MILFLAGVFTGGTFGFIIAALCFAARKGDGDAELH